ncbi:MAG: cysteine hydrolase family protein [Candidatus Bathyarchaeia archaeon]
MKVSKELLRERVDPEHTALLVIDMQNDFVHEQGRFTEFGFDTSMVREAASWVRRVLERARRRGLLIVHTRMINDERQNPPSWLAFWGKPTVTVEGTWGADFFQGFEPLSEEVVLTKYTYGAFHGTNLENVLRNRGVKTVVAVGTGPNICLGDTVHEAFARGYHVVVPEEAVAAFSKHGRDFTKKVKEVGLYIIENHYGIVCSVEELLEAWSQSPVKA